MAKRIFQRSLLSTVVITSLIVQPAYAVLPGFYLGFATGPATNSGNEQFVQGNCIPDTPGGPSPATCTQINVLAKPKSSQWGQRIFIGYKYNNYAGVEFGGNLFSKTRYDTGNQTPCTNPSVRVKDADLMVRGSFDIQGFEAFIEGGVSYVYSTVSGAFSGPFIPPPEAVNQNIQCGKNTYTAAWKPIYGIGASYALNQSFVISLSAIRLQVGGQVKNLDFYSLGLAYAFVNVYCGQFLC